MANLGSIAAVKAKAATILKKRKAPDAITPAEHLELFEDLCDTINVISGVTKDTWSGVLNAGYTNITHSVGSDDFQYDVLVFDSGSGKYKKVEVLEVYRDSTTLRIYYGSGSSNAKANFI